MAFLRPDQILRPDEVPATGQMWQSDTAEGWIDPSTGRASLVGTPKVGPTPESPIQPFVPKSDPLMDDFTANAKPVVDLMADFNANAKPIPQQVQVEQPLPTGAAFTAKETVKGMFPSTTESVKGIAADPFNVKPLLEGQGTYGKQVYDASVGSIVNAVKDEGQRIADAWNQPHPESVSKQLAAGLKIVGGAANIVFSPITALFGLAEQVPVLGTISKAITLPFAAGGDIGGGAAMEGVKALPIPQQDKDNLTEAVGEIGSLAGMILIGGKISHATTQMLKGKYGEEGAKKIVELATEKARATQAKTFTPEQRLAIQDKIQEAKAQAIQPPEMPVDQQPVRREAILAEQPAEAGPVSPFPEQGWNRATPPPTESTATLPQAEAKAPVAEPPTGRPAQPPQGDRVGAILPTTKTGAISSEVQPPDPTPAPTPSEPLAAPKEAVLTGEKTQTYTVKNNPGRVFTIENVLPKEEFELDAEQSVILRDQNGKSLEATIGDLRPSPEGQTKVQGQGVEQVKAETREADKSGFVSLPDDRTITKIKVAVKSFLGKFSSSHGLSTEINSAFKRVQDAIDSLAPRNVRWKSTVSRLESELVRNGLSKEDAATAVREVVHGQATADDLAQAFNIDPAHEGIKSLKEFDTVRKQAAADLGVFLRKTGHNDLAKMIEDNPNYVTRAYRLFEKDGFNPEPAARQSAVDLIKQRYEERLAKIERIAQRMQTNRGQPTGLDVPTFLESKGPTLDGVPANMSNSRTKRLLAVREAYRNLKDITAPIEIDPTTGKAKIRANDKNLTDAAESIIDELLDRPDAANRQGQTFNVNNLKKRVLGDVFRELYGEIKEPVNEMMRTGEVQGRLLASQALMDHLSQIPEASSKVPLAEKGLIEQLPADTKKFGAMAGRYVQPNLAFFLKGQESTSKFMRGYHTVLSAMRFGNLISHKAMARNAYTSITGFGLQTGEAIDPRYGGHAVKAIVDLVKYASGNVEAAKKMEKYAKEGVFSLGGTASAQDIAAWSPGKFKQWAAKVYSSMDFAAQAASYEYQTKTLGKSHAEAVKWLDTYYQRAQTTPIAARWLSRNTPFSDYLGYTAQTIRMTKNGAILAVKSLKNGNPIPLMGFAMAHALGLAYLANQEELLRRGVTSIRKKFGHDPEATDVAQDTASSLGDFMPDYWKTTPKATWVSKVDGKPVMRTLILGGLAAYPLDDTISGIYSYLKNNPKMDNMDKLDLALSQSAGQMFDPNMLVAAGIQTTTGKSTQKNFPDKPGLIDVFRVGPVKTMSDPAGQKMLRDMALELGGRFNPYLRTIAQAVAANEREKAGQKPMPGQKTTDEITDNLLSFMRMETYDKDRALQAINNRLRSIATTEAVKPLTESESDVGKVSKAILERGAATPTQLTMAKAGTERRKAMLEEMRGVVAKAKIAFKPLEVSNTDIWITMSVQGLNEDEKGYVLGMLSSIPATQSEMKNRILLQSKP